MSDESYQGISGGFISDPAPTFKQVVEERKKMFERGESDKLDAWWVKTKSIILSAIDKGEKTVWVNHITGGQNRLKAEGFESKYQSGSYRSDSSLVVTL